MQTVKDDDGQVKPVIPDQGTIIHEEKPFFILCKPKLLPLKSITLEKLEKLQRDAEEKARQGFWKRHQMLLGKSQN